MNGPVAGALQVAAAVAIALWAAMAPPRWMPVIRNHRGSLIPASLGFALLIATVIPALATDLVAIVRGEAGRWVAAAVAVSVPSVLVFGVGLLDDLQPSRIRGWRAHLGALRHGRVTTGVAKLVVIAGASLTWVLLERPFGLAALLDAAVIAGCANLWNLFDLAPGRALKLGVLAAAVLLAFDPTRYAWQVLAVCLTLLPFDLRERAMLGDSGANLLGFLLGQLLVARLAPSAGWAAAVALAVLIGLHVVADTVGFSTVIRTTPPLRWLDDVGRLPAARRPDPKEIPPSTGT
jgi:UDP-N-acetylmuramyl pentapeptide phosphotransferase/UDP-N-acetylglucosamine-1-phosphate transferase